MAVLEFGGNVPAGYTQIEWTAGVPAGYTQIEWTRSAGTIDSRASLEWIASTAGNLLAVNAAVLLEWVGSAVRDILAPAESESAVRIDRRIPIETIRLLFPANAIANMEALGAASGDLWIERESGFVIPAPLLTIERGRLLATHGRLRILKVY